MKKIIFIIIFMVTVFNIEASMLSTPTEETPNIAGISSIDVKFIKAKKINIGAGYGEFEGNETVAMVVSKELNKRKIVSIAVIDSRQLGGKIGTLLSVGLKYKM